MVFNYVPRGYHGSSISSVWQCNSLCPAAMSAKLRQFTCSCSYIALGKSDLPSILRIHLIFGTHSLTPQNVLSQVWQSRGGEPRLISGVDKKKEKKKREKEKRQSKAWLTDWRLSLVLCYVLIWKRCQSSWVKALHFSSAVTTVLCGRGGSCSRHYSNQVCRGEGRGGGEKL